MYRKNAEKLLEFIKKSPSAFQAVEQMKKRLLKKGFTELSEKECWDIHPGRQIFYNKESFRTGCFFHTGRRGRPFSHTGKPQ